MFAALASQMGRDGAPVVVVHPAPIDALADAAGVVLAAVGLSLQVRRQAPGHFRLLSAQLRQRFAFFHRLSPFSLV